MGSGVCNFQGWREILCRVILQTIKQLLLLRLQSFKIHHFPDDLLLSCQRYSVLFDAYLHLICKSDEWFVHWTHNLWKGVGWVSSSILCSVMSYAHILDLYLSQSCIELTFISGCKTQACLLSNTYTPYVIKAFDSFWRKTTCYQQRKSDLN